MRFRSGMICALVGALALGGCAAAAAGGGGVRTAPSGKIYEPGIPPRETAQSRAATLGIATSRFEDALAQAQAGIAADSANPIHFFLAGEAAAGLGQYDLANEMWTRAETMYPAYELDIEPSRETYWATEYNNGIAAYNAGNPAGAIEAWTKAHALYKLRPTAAQNLAVLLAQAERYDDAVEVYTEGLANLSLAPATRLLDSADSTDIAEARVFMEDNLVQLLLFNEKWAEAEALLRRIAASRPDDTQVQVNLAAALAGLNRDDESNAIYTRVLSSPDMGPVDLFNIGVSLFTAGQLAQSAEAFSRVAQLIPNHRDAWFNQANALYEAQAWTELVPVGVRHSQVDPLSETAGLIHARALRELMRNNEALEVLTRVESLPIYVEDLQFAPAGDGVVVRGKAFGNAAPVGTPIRLLFTFYAANGSELGTQTVSVNAPAREVSTDFEVRFDQPAVAYQYRQAP